jgi:hypothetical protein
MNGSEMQKLKNRVIELLSDENHFDCLKTNKNHFVILVDGKRIRTCSGKSIWTGLGAAKSALRNHMKHIYSSNNFTLSDYKVYNEHGILNGTLMTQALREAEEEWIKQHVLFMPFSRYILIQKKK